MRAPMPGPTGAPAGALHGLYEVIGQQFPAPAATGATYHVTLENATGASWFCFEPAPGERASGNCTDETVVSLTPEFFREHTPAATLEPLTVTGPVPMQLYDLVPPSYAVEHAIPWQPADPVALPGPTGPTGPVPGVVESPSVWMFPRSLLSRLQASGPTGPTASTPPYELLATRTGGPVGATAQPLERYSWATAIPLTVSRALDDSGTLVAGAYEIVGVGESVRELLLEAWSATTAAPSPRDRLYLLRQAGRAGPNDQGLVSDALSRSATFLLRTNLSTETHAPGLGAALAGSGDYFARIAEIGPFLKEVWEATITASGGFHMTYADASGQGLPDELFASDGAARLLALLLLDRQSAQRSPERGLRRFNNCVVVGEGLDAAATSLVVSPRNPAAQELRRSASVPPGVVGFGLARANPHGATGPNDMTRRLHSLLGYEVTGPGSYFRPSNASLPLGPVEDTPAWLRLPPGPTHAYWVYQQVVPIAQFGIYNACPDSPALPAAAENPYAGITGPSGAAGPGLSSATLELAYHDVYGNTTATTQPPGQLELAVGYTDELIGVAAWPGAALTYIFEAGATVQLSTSLSLQADRYVPGAGSSFESAVRTANSDAERYRALFYQLQQRDVSFALGSNLGTAAADPADLRAAMTAFVTKAKLYADTTVTLRPLSARTETGETLASLSERLSVTVAMLLEANSDADAVALFPTTYVKPHIVAASAMDTLSTLAERVVGRSGVPVACPDVAQPDSSCAAPAGLLKLSGRQGAGELPASAPGPRVPAVARPADVATQNARQPLTPGNVLRTETRKSEPLPAKRTSLRTAAQWLTCPLLTEAIDPDQPSGPRLEVGLLIDSWKTQKLIADGVELSIAGVEITTKDDTLESIYERVSPPGQEPTLTRGELAAALADIEQLLIAGATLSYATLIVPPAPSGGPGPGPSQPVFALADVPADAGAIELLASLNRCVTSFFYAGSPLLLGYACCTASSGETPASLARDAGVTVAQLASYNAPTTVGPAVELTVPEVTFLPRASDCWATFAPYDADTLATIAAAVGANPAAVADLNRKLPGIFRSDASVTVDGKRTAVDAEDSLDSAFERSGAASWDAFVVALEQPVNAGIYRQSGAVVTPLPLVPEMEGQAPPLEELAAQLHIDAAVLLTANRTQHGLLRVGAKVLGPPATPSPASSRLQTATPIEVQVGEFDTILSVLRRLQALGSPATIESLIEANRGRSGLLTGGATALLAPVASELTVPFTPTLPPTGSEGESGIVFPVEVWIEIARDPGLVHPDFRGTAAVRQARSSLAPRIAGSGEQRLGLKAFAVAFELAFAAQPLKCAVAQEEQGDTRATRIWAVNFGAGGVSRLAVDPSKPAFYALQPLSTTTWSGELHYPSYVSGKGLCADVARRVQSVDVDAWMRKLLATIDLALTPGYAVPAFRMQAPTHSGSPASSPSAQTHHPLDALSRPTPLPQAPDPLSGPMGLASAAQLSRPALGALPFGASGCTGPTASGPADYERLVGAKEGIAGALRERVAPIVQAPGATGPYQLEWARDALYQQMLVRLSDGYDVNAVVQLPCEVDSPMITPPPGVTAPAPPRAAGKVVPVLHTIPPQATSDAGPPSTSLAAVAMGYGVSAAFLAQVIASGEGLLRADAVIAGKPVGDHGTIDAIAKRVDLPTDPSDPRYWDLWVPFIDGFATQDVLQKGAAIPVSALTRMVSPGESLTAIGEFFARDGISVGRANQESAGILTPGPVLVTNYPEPYEVTRADTLLTLAEGISKRNTHLPELTVSKLLLDVVERGALLAPGALLRMVETVPGLSLSTSKVSLGPVGRPSGPPPPLTFLVTVKQEAEHATLLLNLDYVINELEYGIRDVANAGSYQSSSWLTFVLALDGSDGGVDAGASTEIPQIQVPIPLRAYPPASLLDGQSGIASNPGSDVPAKAREWDYRFDVQTRKAAQDSDHLRVLFGERGYASALDGASQELMRWLGAYVEASSALSDDLARLPTVAPGAYDPQAAYALQALSVIADRVAAALHTGELFAAAGATAAQTYGYQMTTLTNGDELAALTLTPEQPGPDRPWAIAGPSKLRDGSGIDGPLGASATWPLVYVHSPTAPTGGTGPDAGYLQLGGTGGVYTYPGGFLASEQQTYRFRFDGRDVIRNRTGRGAIAVTRNDRLIARGPLGPSGSPAPVPTTDGFVYRTPYTQFVDPVIPLIAAEATIDVASLGREPMPQPLARHIENLVQAATDVAADAKAEPADIELAVAYGFPAGDDLLVRTPICLVPCRELNDGNVAEFASQLAGTLAYWRQRTSIDQRIGLLAFELSVFANDATSGSGPGAQTRRPILRFTDLRLHMPDIVWPSTEEHRP
jgi:hypothetical protein